MCEIAASMLLQYLIILNAYAEDKTVVFSLRGKLYLTPALRAVYLQGNPMGVGAKQQKITNMWVTDRYTFACITALPLRPMSHYTLTTMKGTSTSSPSSSDAITSTRKCLTWGAIGFLLTCSTSLLNFMGNLSSLWRANDMSCTPVVPEDECSSPSSFRQMRSRAC
jgi:hypothetical protein